MRLNCSSDGLIDTSQMWVGEPSQGSSKLYSSEIMRGSKSREGEEERERKIRDLGVKWQDNKVEASIFFPLSLFAKELEPGARKQAGPPEVAPPDPSCQLLGVFVSMNVQRMLT